MSFCCVFGGFINRWMEGKKVSRKAESLCQECEEWRCTASIWSDVKFCKLCVSGRRQQPKCAGYIYKRQITTWFMIVEAHDTCLKSAAGFIHVVQFTDLNFLERIFRWIFLLLLRAIVFELRLQFFSHSKISTESLWWYHKHENYF